MKWNTVDWLQPVDESSVKVSNDKTMVRLVPLETHSTSFLILMTKTPESQQFTAYPRILLMIRSPASSTTTKWSPAMVSPVTCPDTYFDPRFTPFTENMCTE
jgi:hypothetical protein